MANTSSGNESSWDTPTQWHRGFSSTIAAVLIVAALVAILGNAMVLTVIIRHRGMRTRTNLFLVNLAVADLLVGILLMPFSIITMISDGWIFGDGAMCQFNGWMNSFCLITSIHTLMYIGVHKYFSIAHPLSTAFKLRTIVFFMCMAWVWAGICSTMNVWGLEVEYKKGTSQCGPKYPRKTHAYIIHAILQLTVMIVPFFILVFCYTRMFIEIKKHSARLRKNSTVEEEYILATQKKVAVTLFIVLACFFFMALPYVSYATYTTVNSNKEFPSFLNPVAYMFLYLNSMVNPIIYAFRSPAFREGYKEILCQTPNYVISDDSDFAPRTNRLASLVSNMRRSSNNSVTRLSAVLAGSMQDISTPELKKTSKVSPVPPTPTTLSSSDALSSKRARLKKTRRKSLFDLLKATRQSNAQSVVHRNGDMIIMKGGKIVSVHRREQPKENNDLLDRLTKLAQSAAKSEVKAIQGMNGEQTVKTANNLEIPIIKTVCAEEGERYSESGEGVESKAVGDSAQTDGNGEVRLPPKESKAADDNRNMADQASDAERNYTQQTQNLDRGLHAITGIPKESNPPKYSAEDKKGWDEANNHGTTSNVSTLASRNTAQIRTAATDGCIQPQAVKDGHGISDQTSSFSFPDTNDTTAPAIFINLDDDDHVTGVIPLSPVTQEHLERAVKRNETDSDFVMSLQHDLVGHPHFERHQNKQGHQVPSRHGRLYSGAPGLSRSSEDLSSVGPRLLRLPSVEYLNPPSKLRASNSSASLRAPSYEAWKKQAALRDASCPQRGLRARLHKLHLSSMRRTRHPPKQETNTQM